VNSNNKKNLNLAKESVKIKDSATMAKKLQDYKIVPSVDPNKQELSIKQYLKGTWHQRFERKRCFSVESIINVHL